MFERGKTNMNRRYRKTIIAGNWKMNKTPAEAKALIEEMKPLLSKTQVVRDGSLCTVHRYSDCCKGC